VPDQDPWLTDRFEAERARLRSVAYRMLGSTSDAEDAVQETWLRLHRQAPGDIDNVSAWLTTVVARVSLNMLRSRRTRGEQSLELVTTAAEPAIDAEESPGGQPEQEAVLADSVGLALLVVLDTLSPAERLAFVLHDMFDLPFDEIAPLVDRTPTATRQLASRARRRVRGREHPSGRDRDRQRRLVEAYLAAVRAGDFEALVAILDPEIVLHADGAAASTPTPRTLRGAQAVAHGAVASAVRAPHTALALVDGSVGLVMAVEGRLAVALAFRTTGDRISEIDVIADPQRLQALDVSVLD
jgi:RNA polymerase sigma-70 factor (ECF subfamily)